MSKLLGYGTLPPPPVGNPKSHTTWFSKIGVEPSISIAVILSVPFGYLTRVTKYSTSLPIWTKIFVHCGIAPKNALASPPEYTCPARRPFWSA